VCLGSTPSPNTSVTDAVMPILPLGRPGARWCLSDDRETSAQRFDHRTQARAGDPHGHGRGAASGRRHPNGREQTAGPEVDGLPVDHIAKGSRAHQLAPYPAACAVLNEHRDVQPSGENVVQHGQILSHRGSSVIGQEARPYPHRGHGCPESRRTQWKCDQLLDRLGQQPRRTRGPPPGSLWG
jgi:hypothetical protein